MSHEDEKRYDGNCGAIIDRELAAMQERGEAKAFCKFVSFMKHTRFVRGVWNRTAVRAMYEWRAPDWAPLIEYRRNEWKMVD